MMSPLTAEADGTPFSDGSLNGGFGLERSKWSFFQKGLTDTLSAIWPTSQAAAGPSHRLVLGRSRLGSALKVTQTACDIWTAAITAFWGTIATAAIFG
jgi:hypothetical protein